MDEQRGTNEFMPEMEKLAATMEEREEASAKAEAEMDDRVAQAEEQLQEDGPHLVTALQILLFDGNLVEIQAPEGVGERKPSESDAIFMLSEGLSVMVAKRTAGIIDQTLAARAHARQKQIEEQAIMQQIQANARNLKIH